MAANKDQHRVTKDTSARKSIEDAAQLSATTAFWKTLKAGWETKFQSMQTGHEAEISKIRANHEQAIMELKAQQNPVKNAATPAAQADQQVTIDALEAQVTALKRERDELKARVLTDTSQKVHQLESEIATLLQENSQLKGQPKTNRVNELEAEKETLKTKLETQRRKNEKLQSQLTVGPNSWFEVHFRSQRRKDRSYVQRPATRLEELIQKLKKDSQKKTNEVFAFSHNGKDISVDQYGQTLQQLGIKSGDNIWYE